MLENKREFYKFWLGFIEKTFLVFLVSIFVPILIGQLKIPFFTTTIWILIALVLLGIAGLLSWKLWSLK